jgi:hypothetical protein
MATYLLNILPSKTKHNLTPTFLLYHKHPQYSHLRTFGCLCFPLSPTSSVHKLENRSKPCVFLGYPSNHRGYRCFDLVSRKVIISRHVIFDEQTFPFASPKPTSMGTYDFLHSFSDSNHHPVVRRGLFPATPIVTESPTDSRFQQTYQCTRRRPAPLAPVSPSSAIEQAIPSSPPAASVEQSTSTVPTPMDRSSSVPLSPQLVPCRPAA